MIELIKDIWEDWIGKIFLIGFIIIVPIFVWASVMELKEWNQFKIDHDCKIVEKTQPSYITGIGTDGNTTLHVQPGRDAWKCDDGVTYWRDR